MNKNKNKTKGEREGRRRGGREGRSDTLFFKAHIRPYFNEGSSSDSRLLNRYGSSESGAKLL